MKNAIGTSGRCRSELDISNSRLTVLSWIPVGGNAQERRAALAEIPALRSAACAAA